MSPSSWHRHQRMGRATEHLGGDDSIANIAVALGFFDQAHFTNAFRRFFRLTPGAYRTGLTIGASARRNVDRR